MSDQSCLVAVRVVEDDPDIGLVVKMLAELTPRVCVHLTGDDFDSLMDPAQWVGIHVAVIDLNLGGTTTGLDLCRWLRSHLPEVRRVLLTAAVLHPDLRDVEESGLATVLQKPVDAITLRRVLRVDE